MDKKEAIELLKQEDITNMLNLIKKDKLEVRYCNYSWCDLDEVQKWSIEGNELIDFISYYYDFNLHWSQWCDDLIKELKKLEYKIEE